MELEATFQSKRPRLSGAVDAMSVDAVPDVSGGGLGVVDVSGAGVATSVATSVDAGVPMDVSVSEVVDAPGLGEVMSVLGGAGDAMSMDAGVPMDVSGPEFVDALMVIEKL